ncbi:hypothetical protein E2C01_006878 [Portunus trituberculatus]|uniref:Uncharacterized protein n=1 Tax=Portunus trituberculatus TaxID=210409 RepID=A0A5B7CYI3_PORTR|nr:hypothetical protein [Portunus trituberculatus]
MPCWMRETSASFSNSHLKQGSKSTVTGTELQYMPGLTTSTVAGPRASMSTTCSGKHTEEGLHQGGE